MKRSSLIAGVASIAAMAAVLWSMPAAADSGSTIVSWSNAGDIGSTDGSSVRNAHDKFPDRMKQAVVPAADAPEPGTLALLAFGLGGIGLGSRRRRR